MSFINLYFYELFKNINITSQVFKAFVSSLFVKIYKALNKTVCCNFIFVSGEKRITRYMIIVGKITFISVTIVSTLILLYNLYLLGKNKL